MPLGHVAGTSRNEAKELMNCGSAQFRASVVVDVDRKRVVNISPSLEFEVN